MQAMDLFFISHNFPISIGYLCHIMFIETNLWTPFEYYLKVLNAYCAIVLRSFPFDSTLTVVVIINKETIVETLGSSDTFTEFDDNINGDCFLI